jgi:hypothetical protein
MRAQQKSWAVDHYVKSVEHSLAARTLPVLITETAACHSSDQKFPIEDFPAIE